MPNWNDYTKPNLGLLFYKHIYNEQTIRGRLKEDRGELSLDIPKSENPFAPFYKTIFSRTFETKEQIENAAANHRFHLFTTYPGLLTGSGYQHNTKANGDFKIGFFFDHSTGQPLLPGSTIKGVLHSLFEMDKKQVNDREYSYTGEKSVKAIQFICDKIIKNPNCKEPEKWKQLRDGLNEISLKKISDSIFGTEKLEGTDVFYDTVIEIARSQSKDKKFLASDFITPHHENLLKNPIPLMFLKVLPNVAFEFRFKLKDTDKDWTADRKEKLFKQILLAIGAGAKTNVGYGQFSETAIKPVIVADNQQRQQNNPRADNRDNRNRPAQRDYRAEVNSAPAVNAITIITSIKELKENCSILAKVSSIKSDPIGLTFEFELDGKLFKAETNKYADANNFPVGTAVIIKVKNLEGKKPNFSKITILSVTLSNA